MCLPGAGRTKIALVMTGPQFLVFYVVLVILACILEQWLINRGERSGIQSMYFASDPYRVATLRAGNNEAIRVAVFSLVNRGVLRECNGMVQTSEGHPEKLASPLELAIARVCQSQPFKVSQLQRHPELWALCGQYEKDLVQEGLLCKGPVKKRRILIALTFAGIVEVTAGYRAWYAIQHGHSNLEFLVILAVVAGYLLLIMPLSRRTTADGRECLEKLQKMMGDPQDLARKLHAGDTTDNAMMFASVFGLGMLPAGVFAFSDRLFPQPVSSSGSDSSSSDSSSGCGGGCGGCGGSD